MGRKTLIVITGATASGKTQLALDVAASLSCDIISADSRQIYSGLPIGTAAPSAEDLARVHHHFVGTLPLDADYSAAAYADDVAALLPQLWAESDYAVMCGGSMMYIDAVTDGVDALPSISPEVRATVSDMLAEEGLPALLERLRALDPVWAARVDAANPRRVVHALEVCIEAGVPYSSLCGKTRPPKDFDIVKIAIDMPRPELYDRINRRVDAMIAGGLEEEARAVTHLRHLNSLNTVGYKEMFDYIDGRCTLTEAAARIARNTRVYAKKQLTWLRRPSVRASVWLATPSAGDVLSLI